MCNNFQLASLVHVCVKLHLSSIVRTYVMHTYICVYVVIKGIEQKEVDILMSKNQVLQILCISPNEIHENLISSKINNYTIQY